MSSFWSWRDGHRVPPIIPPLVVSLVLGLLVPPVSLSEETDKDELPPHSVPPDLCSSFLPQWREMESFSFTGKKDRSVCSFSPLIFTSSSYPPPRPGDPKSSFLPPEELTDPLQTFITLSCSPCSDLLLNNFLPPHPPSCLPTRGAAVEITVPRRFPTLLCCYSNSSKEAAVLQQPHRNPHMSLYELSLPSSSTRARQLQRQRKPEHKQPVYELFSEPVRLAGLAVIVIESLTG